MESRLTDSLRVVFILTILLATGSSENDQALTFCGTWRHGKHSLHLSYNLSPGCKGISISANKSSLSVEGQITAQCRRSDVIDLKQFGFDSEEQSDFCLYWEPLLDQLKLQIGGKNLTLCWPTSLQGTCCTDLSLGPKQPEADYGIVNGRIQTDIITEKTRIAFKFNGRPISCKHLCNQARGGPTQVNMIEDNAENPCASSFEVEMNDDFRGYNVTSPVTKGVFQESTATVHLPSALKQAVKMTTKVVCTFFRNNTQFQVGHKEVRILSEVVEITVENEIIIDLPEPIRIDFYHDAIPKMHSRKCVSWDTRKNPLQVSWLVDGCITQQRGAENTECLCNHLTYFSVLVQLEPQPVRHLLALTIITSLGCAMSVISCVVLITFLCRKSRRPKEQSKPIHLGLAVSLAALNLLFFFTGVLANVGGEGLCTWVGAALHYSLLSAFTWMGIEVFYTFWLVCMVLTKYTLPKPYIWNLVGFVLPAVPIVILAAVGDIYGMRELVPSDDISNPYQMCWMKSNDKALLAHYFTTMTILVILVLLGIMMLFLIYWKIRHRVEWRQNRVAFLSIWGLSCLFGTSWGLTFLDFGPLSDLVIFLFCILNSFQGFFLMLRFYMLEWMSKQAGDSAQSSNSNGSTRQHMLKAPEKSEMD
ncbi:adhesion G-protein coupled receptor G1 isoform X1 [Hippoglossus hippoglossus]|uniref:adhesion G-protein coupled receptor G1 isoform X1 n=1 Tax=Hippoglossus hippoglossus TaxID=8267 RepID=UPI00148BA55C|nr:adhesion G-protein coupled receptor G1 isoform X1 [Hippoglossus hippoglossus]XP_034427598.1 adhesion G-protein coupled receptor G1 isoform X1 [Hippoglossus hippoglossus]